MSFLAELVLAFQLTSQPTLLPDSAIRGPAVAEPQLYACLPPSTSTSFCVLTLVKPVGLVLDPIKRELRLNTPAAQTLEIETLVATGDTASFTLKFMPTEAPIVTRALFLSPGIDYTITGRVVTFLPGAHPQAGDVLQFRYHRAQ